MSILYSSDKGWFISHSHLVNTFYTRVMTANESKTYRIKDNIFKISFPFKKTNRKRKRKCEVQTDEELYKDVVSFISCTLSTFIDQNYVKEMFPQLKGQLLHLLLDTETNCEHSFNKSALDLSRQVYADSGATRIPNMLGENKDEAKFISIHNSNFLFPANSRFYCKDVVELDKYLLGQKYDLILLDPPWWNKYIRRKNAKMDDGYQMMFNDDIKMLPLEKYLEDDGLIVVWCTNSLQHLKALETEFFPKWDVQFAAKLFWVKISSAGDPVCDFSDPPGKQPFEQIIIGKRTSPEIVQNLNKKLLISIPSALHSHKPPLTEILAPYLPRNPNCLEIFARYLQPNWTSWGLEVLRFQHESLYEINS